MLDGPEHLSAQLPAQAHTDEHPQRCAAQADGVKQVQGVPVEHLWPLKDQIQPRIRLLGGGTDKVPLRRLQIAPRQQMLPQPRSPGGSLGGLIAVHRLPEPVHHQQTVLHSVFPRHQLPQAALIQAHHQIAVQAALRAIKGGRPLEQGLPLGVYVLTGHKAQAPRLAGRPQHSPVHRQGPLRRGGLGGIAPPALTVIQVNPGIAAHLLHRLKQAVIHLGAVLLAPGQGLRHHVFPRQPLRCPDKAVIGRFHSVQGAVQMGLGLGAGCVVQPQAKNLQQRPGTQQQGDHGRGQKGPEQAAAEGAGPKFSHAVSSSSRQKAQVIRTPSRFSLAQSTS